MEKVLTSQALWQDFNPAKEPLETNVLKSEERGENIFTTLYFTGRTVEDGKTRVLAKVCRKAAKKSSRAVLIVDNYKYPINEEELEFWASNGFVAIAIDFAGRTTKGPCTLYPTSLDYCNSDVAKSYFYIGESAKQTKIYEYALNCMRAITYLVQEEKVTAISVLTIKKGSSVGTIVLGTDKRVTNGVVVFGSLYREYVDIDKLDVSDSVDNRKLAEHIALAEKRQMWEAGIAPQGYAMTTKVPVYLVVAANSPHVSSLNSSKMYYRLNDQSRILMLPLSIDYMSDEYVKSLVNWCKGDSAEEDIDVSQITTEKGDNFVKISTHLAASDLEVWYSRNAESSARNWVKATNLTETEGGYVAELDAYESKSKMILFALAKSSVNITTGLCEIDVQSPSVVKTSTRKIFTGDGSGFLIPMVKGAGFHGKRNQVEYCEGYLNIRGAKCSSVATFAINDPCVRRKDIFTVSFDICCDTPQTLTAYVVTDFGYENEMYTQSVQLLGDGKWERITLDGAGFHNDAGKQMPEDKKAEMLHFEADSEFIINNIFLV